MDGALQSASAAWLLSLLAVEQAAAAEMEHFGIKCHMAWDDFCAAVKCSVNPSTSVLKRPVGETGESRKMALSTHLISVKFSHKWRSSTTRLAFYIPMACAVAFVARRVKSVVLRCSLNAAECSGPDSSMAQRSFTWYTWSTALECNADSP